LINSEYPRIFPLRNWQNVVYSMKRCVYESLLLVSSEENRCCLHDEFTPGTHNKSQPPSVITFSLTGAALITNTRGCGILKNHVGTILDSLDYQSTEL
jgi:hypothetical protein